jgi:hypothetical protein
MSSDVCKTSRMTIISIVSPAFFKADTASLCSQLIKDVPLTDTSLSPTSKPA